MKQIQMVTDGSCKGNGKVDARGGWAVLLRFGAHERELSGHAPQATNNRMELTALLEGLRALKQPCRVQVISDSRYLIDSFEEGRLATWQQNGWRTASRKPVENRDLWEAILAAAATHTLDFSWVKGHAGHPDNARVDQLARQAVNA